MPRFTTTPIISGLTTPEGVAYWANENGVFDIPHDVIPIFVSHGLHLTPFEDVVAVHIEPEVQTLTIKIDAAEAQAAISETTKKVLAEIAEKEVKRRGRPPRQTFSEAGEAIASELANAVNRVDPPSEEV